MMKKIIKFLSGAGVIPLQVTPSEPIDDPRLLSSISIPAHVNNYRNLSDRSKAKC